MAKAMGNPPMSSVHWLTLEEIRAPMPAAARIRQAIRLAAMNSGASEASGATHCTSRNSSMPSSVPVCTNPSANGSAEARMIPAAKANSSTRTGRRRRFGRLPITFAGPISSGSSAGWRAASHR